MKQFIKTIFGFIPFAFGIYAFLLLLWALLLPTSFQKNLALFSGHTFARLQEVKNTKHVDVLFLGSSHAYRGFDTRIFKQAGLKSFNLGSSAQTPLQTSYLLDKYLDSLKPKLVVYEVYPITFTIDGVESSIDLISNEDFNFNIVKMAIKHTSIKVYNTLLLAAWEKSLGIRTREPRALENEHYVSGGYVQQSLQYFDGKQRPKKALSFDQEQLHAFEKNLEELTKRNIDYVLVQAPYPKATYRSFTNLDGFDKRMARAGRYYNFNECMDLIDTIHFADNSHLNQNGVNAFNMQLLDTLISERNLLSGNIKINRIPANSYNLNGGAISLTSLKVP
jgi:hypothetical protein